jgi:sialate O-acetylesterase
MKQALFFLAIVLAFQASAEIKLGTPFKDHAILQREMKVPIWGTANPKERLEITFAEQIAKAEADDNGSWKVTLSPMHASKEPRTLLVRSFDSEEKVEVNDILVGEVWLASGQSNMECPLWDQGVRYRDAYGKMMLTITQNNYIRFIKPHRAWNVQPQKDINCQWRPFTGEAITECHDQSPDKKTISAIAFYYALQLYASLEIPIGIIDASWGGTNIDAWTPRSGYENHPTLKAFAEYPVTNKWDGSMALGAITWFHEQPTVLWNAMVNPFAPYAARGMIWYQGCQNSFEHEIYADKMQALYDGWKKEFQNPDLKIYFVELAPFDDQYYRLRLAQHKFAEQEKNAAFVSTADIGNFYDVHPNKKEIVARRLALHALKNDYGRSDIIADSPKLTKYVIEGDKFILSFDNHNWYYYNDDRSEPKGFEIAGADGEFHPAKLLNETHSDSQLRGTQLIVSSPEVKDPKSLRYLAQPPYEGSIFSEDSNLPLPPFEIINETKEEPKESKE